MPLLTVAIKSPAHSAMGSLLSYSSEHTLSPGTLVRVPLGKAEVLGVVWLPEPAPQAMPGIKPIAGVVAGVPPVSHAWMRLMAFAARYYQRSVGEVAMAALPPQLREFSAVQMARRMKRVAKATPSTAETARADGEPIEVNAQQLAAISQFDADARPALLFGATGSGKTEVYLQLVARLLASNPQGQALVMVPEINLTPQLCARFEARFAAQWGEQAVVSLHSGLTPAQRLSSWLAAHTGVARVVLGTRMGVMASMPSLGLIVVDEEHDPSYKSNDGARYSARDLAVWRGKAEGVRVLLGSATPSLESWAASESAVAGGTASATPAGYGNATASPAPPAARPSPPPLAAPTAGRYLRLHMPSRVGDGALPRLRIANMDLFPKGTVLAPVVLEAIHKRITAGEQTLLLLNRRGYSPVLHCPDCGWKSECPNCSAYRVFHKIDRTLRCHHCSFTQRVPKACPTCGSLGLQPMGKGTEQLEEHLGELLAELKRPDGSPLRIARIDADTTRLKGALETQLAAIHAGEVDVLVGTQMVAKGHDFRRMSLVVALGVDSALFSSDYRAPERLFSLLMQAGGRAGRDAALSAASEIWVQTSVPTHPLFAALAKHDFPRFANEQLRQRMDASLPPFAHQALVRAEARSQEAAQAFLNAAGLAAAHCQAAEHVTIYPAVPMNPQRIANTERTQMLLESSSRPALQSLLTEWRGQLQALNPKNGPDRVSRWAIDVDPLQI